MPEIVDVIIGQRIRMHRMRARMSQSALGEAAAVTFQQIQKYERGANRVSASKLVAIAQALKVQDNSVEPDPFARADVIRLAKAYSAIPSKKMQQHIVSLIECMAQHHHITRPEAA